MITRDLTEPGYAAACKDSPPPLHVYDYEQVHANWHPLPRPQMTPTTASTVVNRKQNRADLYGDDPTDPGAQTEPRHATAGMIARLNVSTGSRNVKGGGLRV